MKLLPKGLFKVKKKENLSDMESSTAAEFIPVTECGQWGWERARTFQGAEPGLLICMKCLFESHKNKIRGDKKKQAELMIPYKVKREELLSKNKHFLEKINKLKERDKPILFEKIESINNEVREIRKKPSQYLGSDVGKAGYIIGLIILIFLTIYLFVFYSSASYSAFFKTFTLNEIGVTSSIFDPHAVTNALKEGILELVLILTIPFVFLGLGYLIHKFQEEKGWKKIPKIIGFILVTLIFDVILAYGITKEMHDIKAENSFGDLASYTFQLAFENIHFWTIILLDSLFTLSGGLFLIL